MSNYEANPVGFLYERYQSSGVSPLYEVFHSFEVPCQQIILVELGIDESTFQVVMSRGQAHAPIFTAKLTVPQVFEETNMFKALLYCAPFL